MARCTYPPGHDDHPLVRLNPHDCVPFIELLFAAEQGSKMDGLPSPRLMATHMQHSVLPASISNNPDCKIVYVCSKASPETVFLRYEDVLLDPVKNVRKLAQFVGHSFSPAEEDAGVAMDIVRLCSFDKLKNLEINKAGSRSPFAKRPVLSERRGGRDWVNHVTPDMARRLDAIVEEKLRGSGLSFA
ncbi:hypothetical protein BAE44_0012871 [Dichanthelium oligosanthes]|uniref:Sulfotransferase n=1 Tax=Dichanthelium oligosanthes TaxID=888268 RepID=A0A1E5VLV1_9POAL|nr:hypothetical protein BAE44_0012871 [Dichanthelium oligosanthes]